MPETPVHEYHRAIPAQHYIRTTRQARMIQPIAETACKEVLPHQHFRFGVLAMYCRHTAMPLLFCHLVHNPSVVVTAKVGILFFTKRWHDVVFSYMAPILTSMNSKSEKETSLPICAVIRVRLKDSNCLAEMLINILCSSRQTCE